MQPAALFLKKKQSQTTPFDQIFEHVWFTHDTNVTRMENKIQDAPPLPLELRFGAAPLPVRKSTWKQRIQQFSNRSTPGKTNMTMEHSNHFGRCPYVSPN